MKSTKGVGYKTSCNFSNNLLSEGKHLKFSVKLNKLSEQYGGKFLGVGGGGGWVGGTDS